MPRLRLKLKQIEIMSERYCRKTIRISTYLVSKIELIAEKENRSFNNMVETLLIRKINES